MNDTTSIETETPQRNGEAGRLLGAAPCSASLPPVLDACCGGRMMWFNKSNPLALYMDKRRESLRWDDAGMGKLEVNPDVLADFTAMPFPDESFNLVVFDPPHMNSLGQNSKMAQLYGRLLPTWHCDIGEGFKECFRVLKPLGTLIFKWNECEIPLDEVVKLSPIPPLFGHATKRHGKTHWLAFLKPNDQALPRGGAQKTLI
jgi:ubiquinone/menaquinone biosynthesis C-methylase UbiE